MSPEVGSSGGKAAFLYLDRCLRRISFLFLLIVPMREACGSEGFFLLIFLSFLILTFSIIIIFERRGEDRWWYYYLYFYWASFYRGE